MRTNVGRGSLRLSHRLLWRAALFVLLCVVSFACREGTTLVAPPSQSSLHFAFGRGARAVYNNWQLDEFGFTIPASQYLDTWTVSDTASHLFNRSSVTIVVDTTFKGTSTRQDSVAGVDSLFFYTSPSGDLYQYGFLSALLKRRTGTDLKPTWDLIAAFSRDISSTWIVGYADSTTPVYASISGTMEFDAVDLNGMQTVIQSYVIELVFSDFDAALWLSGSPPMIFRERDESNGSADGTMREMISYRTVGG